MTASGEDAYGPTQIMTPAGGSSESERSPRTSSPRNQSAMRLVGLAVLIHMLRSRRFYERLAFGAIVVASLRGLTQENRTVSVERVVAMVKRQDQRLERKAVALVERQERRLERKAKHLQRKAR